MNNIQVVIGKRLHVDVVKELGTFIGLAPHNLTSDDEKIRCKGIDFYFFNWRLHVGYWFNN